MEKENKKRIASILGVSLLVLLVVGTTYAAFTFTGKGTKENKITTGSISMTYTEDEAGIQITNAEPILDSVGKAIAKQDTANGITNGYFDFTVSATMNGQATIRYDIYATNLSTEPSLGEEFVKVYLTNGKDGDEALPGFTGTVPVFSSFGAFEDVENARVIYSSTLDATNLSQNFRLRLWVADTFTDGSTSRNFKIKLGVKAEQAI